MALLYKMLTFELEVKFIKKVSAIMQLLSWRLSLHYLHRGRKQERRLIEGKISDGMNLRDKDKHGSILLVSHPTL